MAKLLALPSLKILGEKQFSPLFIIFFSVFILIYMGGVDSSVPTIPLYLCSSVFSLGGVDSSVPSIPCNLAKLSPDLVGITLTDSLYGTVIKPK